MPKYVFEGTVPCSDWSAVFKAVVAPLRRIGTGNFRMHVRFELDGIRPQGGASLIHIRQDASKLGLRMAVSVVDDMAKQVQVYDSPSGKGMCAMCTEDVGPCEGYPCVNAQPKFVEYRG